MEMIVFNQYCVPSTFVARGYNVDTSMEIPSGSERILCSVLDGEVEFSSPDESTAVLPVEIARSSSILERLIHDVGTNASPSFTVVAPVGYLRAWVEYKRSTDLAEIQVVHCTEV